MRPKNFLLAILLGLISLPLLQSFTGLLPEKELKGAITAPADVKFSWKEWTEESYQKAKEAYINGSFGLRSWLIGINNQVDFSLFSITHANGVVVGKENYLYEKGYINAYYGRDFIGWEEIEKRTEMLSLIRDSLKAMGSDLLIVFAAGKGSFYPEYFPDSLKGEKRNPTNYEAYKQKFSERSLDYVDFNSYLLSLKKNSRYPLFSKLGIHWSNYAVCLVTDSLIRYIEQKKQVDLADFTYSKPPVMSTRYKSPDNDLEEGLNLLLPVRSYPMAYSEVKYGVKPDNDFSALVIADSYYWQLFNYGLSTNAFNDGKFWFYNRESYDKTGVPKPVSLYDPFQEFKKHKLVILMATEATLPSLGWTFIESTYSLFNPDICGRQVYYNRIKEISGSVYSTPEWIGMIRDKARNSSQSVEDMVLLDTKYMLENENTEKLRKYWQTRSFSGRKPAVAVHRN